jgi:hypothetical protein
MPVITLQHKGVLIITLQHKGVHSSSYCAWKDSSMLCTRPIQGSLFLTKEVMPLGEVSAKPLTFREA